MTAIPVFLIQHIPTGKFLPAQFFRTSNRGTSQWAPWEEKPEFSYYEPLPRVFYSRGKATHCLGQYFRGKAEWVDSSYSSWGVPEQRLDFIKTPEHIPANFRIIKGTLNVNA